MNNKRDVVQVGTGAGAGGGALTAISAAKTGVPISAMAAMMAASFSTTFPRNMQNLTMRPARGLLPLQHSEFDFFPCECPLWVISGHRSAPDQCPLYPQKADISRRGYRRHMLASQGCLSGGNPAGR
jgi:hypothetical protein